MRGAGLDGAVVWCSDPRAAPAPADPNASLAARKAATEAEKKFKAFLRARAEAFCRCV